MVFVRITVIRRDVSTLVYQAKVSPFQIQGVFESMLQLFNQIKSSIIVFGKEIKTGEVNDREK